MKLKRLGMGQTVVEMLAVILVWTWGIGMLPVWAADAQALLAEMDRKRTLPDMSFNLQIKAFEGDNLKTAYTLWGWVKAGSQQNKSLLFFAGPGTVKGRKMLMEGNYAYLLFPKTRNPIRLSPLQILLGETSNGDVVRTGFAKDYAVTALANGQWQDKSCHKFSLAAKESRKDATYRNITLWVEKSSLHPLYAEFYDSNGTLLKKAVYLEYAPIGEYELPLLVDIIDGQNPQKHTQLSYIKIYRAALPDTAFRKEYLEHWTPAAPR